MRLFKAGGGRSILGKSAEKSGQIEATDGASPYGAPAVCQARYECAYHVSFASSNPHINPMM